MHLIFSFLSKLKNAKEGCGVAIEIYKISLSLISKPSKLLAVVLYLSKIWFICSYLLLLFNFHILNEQSPENVTIFSFFNSIILPTPHLCGFLIIWISSYSFLFLIFNILSVSPNEHIIFLFFNCNKSHIPPKLFFIIISGSKVF